MKSIIRLPIEMLRNRHELLNGYSIQNVISNHRSFAMGIAMISIVLFHIQFQVSWMWPFNLLGYLGVDVFQFVSGFGCVYAIKKYSDVKSFYSRRLLRIIPTCLFVGLLVFLIDMVVGWEYIRYASVVERLFSLHRWYIPLILISYALCPLFYKFIVKYELWAVIALLIGSAALGCIAPKIGIWKWPWFLFRLPPFIVGMYVGIYNVRLNWFHILCSLGAFVCAIAYLLVFWWMYFREWPTEMFAIPYSISLPFLIAGVCYLGKKIKKSILYKAIELLGVYSLEIYLFHEVVLSWLKMHFDSQLLQAALLLPLVIFSVIITKFCVGKVYILIEQVKLKIAVRLN